jgi:hypothetical protein
MTEKLFFESWQKHEIAFLLIGIQTVSEAHLTYYSVGKGKGKVVPLQA